MPHFVRFVPQKLSRAQAMCKTAIVLCGLAALAWQTLAHAASPETRCGELGAQCLCSEPLNTNSFSLVPGTDFAWNPADSTTKECAIEGLAGGVYELSSPNVNTKFGATAGTDATMFAALPGAHTNTYVLRGQDGHTGMWFSGHKLKSTDPTARIAMRFYHYYSPTHRFAGGGYDNADCRNSGKIAELGVRGAITQANPGGWQSYGWSGWGPTYIDCCSLGPGSQSAAAISYSQMRSKWFRTEVVVRNRSGGPGLIMQVFRKNITDGTQEVTAIDTSVPCTTAECGPGTGWTSAMATQLQPPGAVEELWANFFRRTYMASLGEPPGDGQGCLGYQAISHILVAGWNTDQQQRIGAACEIEGGCGSTPTDVLPPVTPSGIVVF